MVISQKETSVIQLNMKGGRALIFLNIFFNINKALLLQHA